MKLETAKTVLKDIETNLVILAEQNLDFIHSSMTQKFYYKDTDTRDLHKIEMLQKGWKLVEDTPIEFLYNTTLEEDPTRENEIIVPVQKFSIHVTFSKH